VRPYQGLSIEEVKKLVPVLNALKNITKISVPLAKRERKAFQKLREKVEKNQYLQKISNLEIKFSIFGMK
jgi:hypothetical protein